MPRSLLLGCLVSLLAALCLGEEPSSLYSPGDHILQLDVDNFNDLVYNKKRGHFVEFYSSWCGACIGYAPLYKKFALETLPWKSIVEVAAVDCSEDKNTKLCREHAIGAFPTIKYFKYMSHSKDDGKVYTGDKHELATLPLDVAELVHDDWVKQRASEWPIFDFLDSEASVEEMWRSSDPSTTLLGVFIDAQPSRIAWAEMINFHSERRVRIVLLSGEHAAAQKLTGGGKAALPMFFLFKKGQANPVYIPTGKTSWVDIQRKIAEFLSAGPALAPPISETAKPDSETHVWPYWSQFEVQMLDIASAMYYMLTEEIPRRQLIEGENMEALKIWIHMLKKYAPGTTPMRRLFYRIDEWLQVQKRELTADQWTAKVESIQSDLGHPLPVNMTWLACRGSKPYLRGYTCGLWTLMHLVTVEAFKMEENNPSFKPATEIIEPIHQFIWRFLSCEICGQHFHKHVQKTDMSQITRAEHAVMWLWRAHNIANKVLSKKESDDPYFPKQQFPPPSLCARCRTAGGEFAEREVLAFLLSYYSNIRTDAAKPAPSYKVSEIEDGQLKSAGAKQFNPKFAVGVEKVDRLEEGEQRLRRGQLDSSPQRRWKSIDGKDYAKPYESSAGGRTFYVLWLSLAGIGVFFLYFKYRRNRTKFWKTFYYYNDYKLDGVWTSAGESATAQSNPQGR